MKTHRQLQAVVLDWAGTTIDFGSRAPVRAFQEVFRQRKVEITVAEARGPMGMNKRDHIASIARMPAVAARWEARHGSPPGPRDVDAMYAQFLPVQKQVLGDYAALIPGAAESARALRQRGLRIGSTTGYTRELMEILIPLARRQGYEADVVVTADDVREGRPAPWAIYEAMRQMQVYPVWTVAKVDDTLVGIEAGRNAGAWTVAVAASGNELGMSADEFGELDPHDRETCLQPVRDRFQEAGAHLVIDHVGQLPHAIHSLDARMARGDRPD